MFPGAIGTAADGIYPDKSTQAVLSSWPNEPSRFGCTVPINPKHLLLHEQDNNFRAVNQEDEVATRITPFFRRRLEYQAPYCLWKGSKQARHLRKFEHMYSIASRA